MSPALGGRVLTTGQPGRSLWNSFTQREICSPQPRREKEQVLPWSGYNQDGEILDLSWEQIMNNSKSHIRTRPCSSASPAPPRLHQWADPQSPAWGSWESGVSLYRLLPAPGLFEITCYALKIHENFALYFWACNVTLCVKLLSVNKTEAAERGLSFPMTPHPASAVSVWRQPFCYFSVSLPFWCWWLSFSLREPSSPILCP